MLHLSNRSHVAMDFLGLFGCAAAATSIGFVNFVDFISTGYGSAMALQAVASMVANRKQLHRVSLLHGISVAAYGVRLASFLAARARKPSYRKAVGEDVQSRTKEMPLGKRVGVWLGCSLLYTCMFLPAHAVIRQVQVPPTAKFGLPLMAFGLVFEAEADRQKSKAKAANPSRFVDSGLYRYSQFPNYFGEVVFWTGNLLAGSAAKQSIPELAAGALGWMAICSIIGTETKLQGRKKDKRYGNDPEYQRYVQRTPVLLPGLPR